MLNLQYDQDAEFRAIRKDAKEEERGDNIGKTISIMRDLAVDEDIIAEKVKEKFELSDEEVQQFLDL